MRNFLIKRDKLPEEGGAEGVLGLSQLMLPQHAHAATATSHNKLRVAFKYAANK